MLGGCVSLGELRPVQLPSSTADVPSQHPLRRHDQLQYLSCDFESGLRYIHNGQGDSIVDPASSNALGLAQSHLDAAARIWPYAIMSSNVYWNTRNTPQYRLPGWKRVNRASSPSGLALEEWERIVPLGTRGEIVVAFRGTEGASLRDWRANLSPIEPEQFRESVQYMRGVRERADKEGSTVTVTGHSLGGAIALNMSLRFRNVDYIGFNPSPRGYAKVFFRPRHTANRLTVTERGEVLRTGILLVPYLPAGAFYGIDRLRYDFLKFTRGVVPVHEHSMYLFSRGLLLAAIKNHDIEARRTFRANFSHVSLHRAFSPGDPTHDIAYCQRIFSEAGPEYR